MFPLVLFRDLKPSNILFKRIDRINFSWDDVDVSALQVKISDFGLSRVLPLQESATLTRQRGTFGYWAPEVETGEYGAPADVYSIGVIAHELVTKELPSNRREWLSMVHNATVKRSLFLND